MKCGYLFYFGDGHRLAADRPALFRFVSLAKNRCRLFLVFYGGGGVASILNKYIVSSDLMGVSIGL